RAPAPPGPVFPSTIVPYVETAYHVAGDKPVTLRHDRPATAQPPAFRPQSKPLPAGEDFAIQTMYRFPKNPSR
ncbi:MAG: hypothetical protein ACTHPS_12120, partial [Streptosporangiaceae bacterium]